MPRQRGAGKGPCRRRRRKGMRLLLRPSILLMLAERESHGYELFDHLQSYGFDANCLDTSVLYRDLRDMEDIGLIQSQWEAEDSKGPQRRVYQIRPEGLENLDQWMGVLSGLSERIENITNQYASLKERTQ